ncbi:phosphoribosylglycinamide formyltransferase [uncultured Thiodictyon sp.]|uniref:phosphoribosylglycinamide formyltransferase n=1 Tax=uncultured Thiodictyon sp. TaxID=1846217 RepID=UPI0025D1B668|nr:phosphoribosylglycinamide formyltransferase [uncultured Thiodictyon sp.]
MTEASAARLPVVVLISGGGSNLGALIAEQSRWPYRIAAVISNQPAARGLERALAAGIPAEILDHRDYPDRAAYDLALAAAIDRHAPGLVVLAGFMRILTPAFVARYPGRLLNIHPSLLPKFPGLHTHRRALEAGEREHGASVHFVTAELDGGPAIMQARVPVVPGDSPETLAARVLVQEHRLYPPVLGWFAQGRLRLGEDARVQLDGVRLAGPLDLNELPAVLGM